MAEGAASEVSPYERHDAGGREPVHRVYFACDGFYAIIGDRWVDSRYTRQLHVVDQSCQLGESTQNAGKGESILNSKDA
jgi:hypothetical protein